MKRTIFYLGQITVLAIALIGAPCLFSETSAEDNGEEDKEKRVVFDLGEIVVVGEADEPVPGKVEEITLEDMEIRNARTVADALEYVPGVVVTYGSKNEAKVFLRGFAQEKVAVLLDGVPIYTPYYGDVDLSEVPLANVAKITVTKGAASPFYGINSLGGVINIVTRKPTEKPNIDFAIQAGQDSTYQVDASHGMKKDNFYYQVGGHFHTSDGWSMSDDYDPTPFEDGGLRDNSDYESKGFNFKAGGDWGEEGEVAVNFQYVDAEKAIPTSTIDDRPRYWRFPEWKKWTLSGLGRTKLNETIDFFAHVFYHKYDNVLNNYEDPDFTMLDWSSTYDDYSIGGIFSTTFAFDAFDLRTGFNFTRDNHKDQADIGEPWEEYVMHTFSLIAEGTVPINEDLKLVASASLDFLDQVEGTEDLGPGSTKNAFNPMATLYYNPSTAHFFHFTLAQKTRFPTMNQLYSSRSGNPDLDPQKNIDFEAGYQYSFSEVPAALHLNFFYNRIRDLIDRVSRYDPYENLADASLYGFETGLSVTPHPWFRLSGDYTYISTEDVSDEPLFDELPFTPNHMLNLSGTFTAPFGMSVSAIGHISGKRYEYDRDNNKMEVPGFEVMNLRVEQELYQDISVFFYVQNLFDANYYEELGFEQSGRAFWGGLSLFLD